MNHSLLNPANILGLLLSVALLLAGCQTQSSRIVNTPQAGDRITPQFALEAPNDLHDISGYLLRFRATHLVMPDTLMALREADIMPARGYPGLANYAYRSTGLGVLSDGRTIIVVDTVSRVEGHVWCILAEPARHPRTATLAVSLVPMSDLQAAARTGP